MNIVSAQMQETLTWTGVYVARINENTCGGVQGH